MNVQEMHIEIDISTQKIRSNYYRKFLPSEIDWILNKQVDRFIKDRIKTDQDSLGFDASEMDLDALSSLSVLDKSLRTYKRSGDSEAVYAALPGDYAYLIDDFSRVIESCNKVQFTQASTTTTTPCYLYSFALAQSDLSSGPYYRNISLILNDVTIFSATNLTGLADKTELFAVRDYVLYQARINAPDGIEFHWEEFGNTRTPNSIIAVSLTPQSGSNLLNLDTLVISAQTATIQRDLYPVVDGKLATNRLLRGAYRSQLRTSVFAGALASSPISALAQGNLKVYCDNKYIVSRLSISYIRKPARINLLLNQNCDITPEFHQEICDRASLYISELTVNPDWQVKLRDMMSNKD